MDEFLKQILATQERIATALEQIASRHGHQEAAPAAATAGKPAAEKKAAEKKVEEKPAEPEAPAGPSYTIDEVRAALKEFRAIEGNVAMLEILKKHGGGKESLPEIDAKYYHDIMEAAGAGK